MESEARQGRVMTDVARVSRVRRELDRAFAQGDRAAVARLAKKADAVAHAAELALGRGREARDYVIDALRGRWYYAQLAGPNPGSGRIAQENSASQLSDDGLTAWQRTRWRYLYPLTDSAFDGYVAANEESWPSFEGLVRRAVDAGRSKHGEAPAFPSGEYRTIVIDPPWPMRLSARQLHPEQGNTLPYPTMTLEQIAALPVADFAAPGAHLYLWVTQRFLPDAFTMLEAWGFHYHCLLTWVKPGGFSPFSWMLNAEHAVFAYREPFEIARRGLKVAFDADRNGHSTKPDRFYELVEQASYEPRIELFARATRPGWTVWGDEVA
jgi:N6-adenosine-specific RNA methylase IME4